MPDSRLSILLAAKDQTSPAFASARANLKGLDAAAGSAAAGMGGLVAAAGITGIAVLGQQALSAVAGLSELGFKATALRGSFDDLAAAAGQSGDAILDALRKASGGAISDSNLILAANKAMLLGVASTGEEMAKLMDIATVRGKAIGLTVGQAFNDIVTGLGRGSALILDNLGIVVNATEANEKYAASLGKTAASLTETEKKQALINSVLADATASTGAAVAPSERLAAATDNFKEAVGRFLNEAGGWPGLLNSIADGIGNVSDAISDHVDTAPLREAAQSTVVLDQAIISLTNDIGQIENGMRRLEAAGQQDSAAYRELAAELASTQEHLRVTQIEANELSAVLGGTAGAALDAHEGLLRAGAGMQQLGVEAVIAAGSVDDLVRSLNNETFARSQRDWTAMTSAIEGAAAAGGRLFAGKQGDTAGLARQKAISDELTAQIGYWRVQGYEMEQINDVLLPGYVANIQAADQALFKTVTQTKGLSDAAKEAEKAFSDLKGKVSGVLQAALDPGVGVDPNKILESFGFSEDAINENAKRLADIAANGLKGQDWLGEFAAEAPNVWKAIRSAVNPQEEAAFLLRDFQDGLRPELIDKERAKELVKRILTGDANMAELAQEIATELAGEMGVSMQTALGAAQGALGVAGTGGLAGSDAATAFADSATATMGERGGGSEMIDAFVAQARSVYGRLRTAGQDAGKEFGSGFLVGVSDVPASFVNLLVGLVLPGVRSGLNTDSTLVGAVNP